MFPLEICSINIQFRSTRIFHVTVATCCFRKYCNHAIENTIWVPWWLAMWFFIYMYEIAFYDRLNMLYCVIFVICQIWSNGLFNISYVHHANVAIVLYKVWHYFGLCYTETSLSLYTTTMYDFTSIATAFIVIFRYCAFQFQNFVVEVCWLFSIFLSNIYIFKHALNLPLCSGNTQINRNTITLHTLTVAANETDSVYTGSWG